MINDAQTPSEREDIEQLLPWYATGRLDVIDRARVEAFLARHPEMRQSLSLNLAERSETAFLNGPAEIPSTEVVDRFMAQISPRRSETVRPVLRSRAPLGLDGLLARLRDEFFGPFLGMGFAAWGTAAAALIILIQAAVIFALVNKEPSQGYEIARGAADAVVEGRLVLVRFTKTASLTSVADTLSKLNMSIVSGPKAGGLFTLRIGPDSMSEAERDRLIDMLSKQKDLIAFVTATR